jgi:hypothetical protein
MTAPIPSAEADRIERLTVALIERLARGRPVEDETKAMLRGLLWTVASAAKMADPLEGEPD